MYISAFPTLSFADFLFGAVSPKGKSPLNPREVFYYRGANAVYHAVRLLELSPNDCVLVPAFHCGVEVEAVLSAGAKIKFYNVNEDLSIDFADLEVQADAQTKAVLIIHYFGFPQNMHKVKEICGQKKLLLIEDCAHAFLSSYLGKPLGTFGDMTVFSYQKSLAVADGGGLLVNNLKFLLPPVEGQPGLLSRLRGRMVLWGEHARMFYGVFFHLINALIFQPARFILKALKSGKAEGEVVTVSSSHQYNYTLANLGASGRTKASLQSVDAEKFKQKRRENYLYLAEKLHDFKQIELVWAQLPQNACPLFLPIRVKNRPSLRRRLQQEGIETFLFGEYLHSDLPAAHFPAAQRCSQEILCLPIHQDICPAHLDAIAQKIMEVISHNVQDIDVLHFISSGGFFGAERVILSIVAQSHKQGQSVGIAVLEDAREPHLELMKEVSRLGIPAVAIKSCGRFDFGAIAALKNIIKENSVRILHTHNYKSNLLGLIAARLTKVPIVSTAHGYTRMNQKVAWYERFDRFLLQNFFTRVIVVSDTVKAGVPEFRKRVIRNGVDISHFQSQQGAREKIRSQYGISETDIVIGTVGRLSREKNQVMFLEAAAKAMKEIGIIRIFIIGSGQEEENLKAAAREKGIAEKVIFTGYIENAAPYYQAFDIFVLSSVTEGIPISILEAMASRVPVISTRVGGIPQIIKEDKTGILVPSNDAGALAAQLSALSRDKNKREAIAAAAFQFVQGNYSVEQMCKSYNSVYHEVTA